ncbi:flagellar M-ring protein FliF [Vibrio sp. SS-MA-C1-2]|uniref:flagellar basal-body MS-ring/collar protein FliF n=1 Tax=Vibrio sp. SS-MA-C1-2 TaxID=2908646 RepID=UPI001F325D03|nr:flagellar basal-body MS-ring/collar protein FliF [Vibrio sp. SS-MA-C1-2]UJF18029.1 flagellar M-ring protein FliF [Vibrio sp. SS-MA-C1-2]
MATEVKPALTSPTPNKVAGEGKSKLSQIGGNFRVFWASSQRNLVVITIFASIIAAIIVLLLWSSTERYRPLYSSSSNYDTSQVLQLLDESNIPYQLSSDDGQILVVEKNVAKIRMMLAAKGLKEQLPSGFESLDSGANIGESQFMETARYRHALEGELARSITTMDQINLARVHLAIPKETLFVRTDAEEPRASVIVNIIEGMDIKPAQIDSIINLVSGAVIGLKAENVQVVDQYGRLLSDDASSGDYTVASSKQRDFKTNLENRLVKQASDMLTPILGASNFRVQVSTDIDFSKREETLETFDEPKIQSESITTDSNDSSVALGIPGALSNTPPVTGNDQAPDTNSTVTKSSTDRKYAVGGKITHITHQQGVLNRLSVAIVLNDTANTEGIWTPEQLNNIQAIVMPAIGFNQARGDSINIQSFPFISASFQEATPLPWFENSSLIQPIKYIIALILSVLMILLVLRPLVKYLINPHNKTPEQLLAEAPFEVDIETRAEQARESALKSKMDSLGIDASGIKALEDDLPPADSPIEVQIQHLKLIASEDPQRVTEILRTWMNA